MNLKFRIGLAVLVTSSVIAAAKEKENKGKKPVRNATYLEANVIEGSNQCGYLLLLSNGHTIKPQSLPRKYRENHLKVLVKFEELNLLKDTLCNSDKVVSITEIKRFRYNPNQRSKH